MFHSMIMLKTQPYRDWALQIQRRDYNKSNRQTKKNLSLSSAGAIRLSFVERMVLFIFCYDSFDSRRRRFQIPK